MTDTETVPQRIATENFRLTATGSKGTTVSVIVCGAPDAFEGAKVLAVIASESNMLQILRGIDSERLENEMGIVFDDDDDDDDEG